MSIIPPYLQKGDTVAIVATARKISLEDLQPSIEILSSWGLKIVLGKNIFCVDNQFAGTDEERAEDLQWAIDDADVKAIICARGGYGTIRVIDKIDFANFITNPKWIVGYSDITVLHQHINQNFSVSTIHATMPPHFTKSEEATESLRKALFGEELNYTIPAHTLNKTGETSGELIGGNLSLIYALCGSKSDIDTRGKILFIEDIDEYLYHIDRMMMNLKRSGKLEYLAGLIVGGMTDLKDNAIPYGETVEEIILDAVKEYNFPVCFDFPAGHIDRNMTLVMGKEVKFKTNLNLTSLDFTKPSNLQ